MVRGSIAALLLFAATAAFGQRPLAITGVNPSGTNVSSGRQIVIQFNRAVVPIGRMDRTAAEIPIEIAPALACQWRWLDTSALACQLGDGQEFKLATRYSIVIHPGIRAEDGATTQGTFMREFVTERPRVSFAGFATWRSPGTPVVRAVFTQPVSQSSVREHVYMTLAAGGGARIGLDVRGDDDMREAPRFIRPPGEAHFLDFAEPQRARVDDQTTEVNGEEARRVWLLTPPAELPLDAFVLLMIEPGLEPAEGNELGDESRVVVEFATFPEFRFLGVTCGPFDERSPGFFLPVGNSVPRECNPLRGIGLAFSAPVLASQVKENVTIVPDLAGGRTDYDPWASLRDYTRLNAPHERGRHYTIYLPERLKAAEPYSIRAVAVAQGPKDEFGRTLVAPIDFAFRTSHRPPDFTRVYSTAVLEQGVDSDLPVYVTNLDAVTLRYRTLTAAGSEPGLARTRSLPDIEDIQYAVPLGVREMLGGESGALYGMIATDPPLPISEWGNRVFAQVTPYQVHVKLGHFNTLVWVVDLASGAPVPAAAVSLYVDRIANLAADAQVLATATTDDSGIALLPGTRELDPQLRLLNHGCGAGPDNCPRLFVRVANAGSLAVMPLGYEFEVNAYRASNYSVWSQSLPEFGHLHAWGTTAQGVYRAGDTMDFKLYVRDQSNETYVAAPRGPYTLEIIDPTGETVHTVPDITLSEFGAFSGRYAIPQTASVGWFVFKLTGKFTTPGAHEVVRHPMRVLVSDFTPSSFGVTTELNGDLFAAGDDIVAMTRSTLYSGGPYVDAEARVTAQISSKWFRSKHPAAASFTFGNTGSVESIVVSQFVEHVNAQGELAHQFSIPPDLGKQMVYGTLSVEGAVRDDRGKYVASAASADFIAVDRLVGLKSTRWVFRQNEPASVEYVVVDGRGIPAAGTDVHVAVERLETKAARVKGAGNAYLTEFIEQWLAAGSCDGRSTDAPLTCTFTPAAPGSYRLTASAKDTEGREHSSVLFAWVAGMGQIVWRDRNDDALEIVPEKTEYNIGDTARYLLKNPYPGARALVTIERYGTLKQWVQTLEGSTPMLEFAVEKDFMPGFYLSVLLMSPRVATPPPELGELDLGKPAFKLGYVAVPVEDPYKQIDVEVSTQQEVYRPGETVHARIQAAPRKRETREPIEVAVVVLDEAVLDLIQGGTTYFDPYDGFYALDGLDVRNYSLLTRLVGRQKVDLKGANPGGDGGAALSMRSLFKFVSYWNPSIVLDARGNAEFEFQVPDNLTGWRVLVLAMTPTDRMGLGQADFKVNRPTEIRPVMPNQITEGDLFTAAFSVMNRTDTARDIRVAIAAEGDVTAPAKHEQTVHLEPYQRTTVPMPLSAARVSLDRNRSVGRIAFAVTARDSLDGDGLRHELPVHKRRSLETAANYGSFDGAYITESLRFPDRIYPDVGDVGVVLSPTVIGNVDGAFRYMRDYPYLCWEQRLTKGVMASHYTHLRDYLPEELEWPGSATLADETLAQAANFQAPSGGMGYWSQNEAYVSPYLSAYTALAFNWLRDDGHAIPETVETKLHGYLDSFLKRDVAPDFYSRGMASTVRAVALAALAKRGRVTLADLARYREHVEYMSLFGKAHYLKAALAIEGGETIAREVEQIILQDAVRSGGKISFNESFDDGYLRISATPLVSNCSILSALTEGALSNGEIGVAGDVPFELVRVITQARGSRDHWENTQENMFCMNAVLDYAQRFESVAPSMNVAVNAGGQHLGSTKFGSVRDEAVTIGRPITASDPGTHTDLTVLRSGAGRLYYSARMSYASTEDSAIPINSGIDVRKELSVQRDGTWVLLASPMRIKRGELVRVDLFISLPTARHFVVVDDPVPGGLEPVNRDLASTSLVDAAAGAYSAAGGSWWFQFGDWRAYGVSRWSFYHQEVRHDAVRYYSDYLPPGNYHLSYSAQAIAEGQFTSMPAKAVEMYDPDVYGMSLPGTLVVEGAE